MPHGINLKALGLIVVPLNKTLEMMEDRTLPTAEGELSILSSKHIMKELAVAKWAPLLEQTLIRMPT